VGAAKDVLDALQQAKALFTQYKYEDCKVKSDVIKNACTLALKLKSYNAGLIKGYEKCPCDELERRELEELEKLQEKGHAPHHYGHRHKHEHKHEGDKDKPPKHDGYDKPPKGGKPPAPSGGHDKPKCTEWDDFLKDWNKSHH